MAAGAARPPVGVSTGAFSRFPEYAAPEAVAEGMRRLEGAEIFEVLVFGHWEDPEAAGRTLAAAGRPVAVVHGVKHIGGLLGSAEAEERRRGQALALQAVRIAGLVGAPAVNVHLWDLPGSDRNLERNLEALVELLPAVSAAGTRLLVETVPCQAAVPWEGVQRALDHAERVLGAEGPSSALGVNLDLEFLAWHQGLEITLGEYAPRWAGRLGNVHVRDYDGRPFDEAGRRRYVNPGDGQLDLPRIFAQLAAAGYRGPLIFEGNVTRVGERDAVLAAASRYLVRMRDWAQAAWGWPGTGPGGGSDGGAG